jgi:protein-L-isoaspartate(D-aspartate) O-methyltransferase
MNMEARIQGIGMTSHRTRVRLADRLRQSGIRDESVLSTMIDVPRHFFMDEALSSRAYEDCALPIGEGQTISQPYVVALMTELVMESARPDGTLNRVLEIGTGSGYQAAVLARLVPEVYTLERIKSLSLKAQRVFNDLRIRNIKSRYGDGFDGWQDKAPFDAVVVTAAMESVPESLLAQVRDGGVLIGPVGPQSGSQTLSIMRCYRDRPPQTRQIAGVRFVPFLRGRG